ncbi:MAG TPA: paraslipin [Synechococcales cyanobacterium M55_K2018_004]|nr:paraslipin [Synechococcales cyanobacterium M55_K2018_004]
MEPIVAALALVLIGYTVGSVKIINQGTEALVERLGRYHRKLTPGLNFVVPFLDNIVLEESTKERVLDTKPQDAITKDNVSVVVDAVMYWRILQLERTYYAVEDVEEALENLVTTTLRSEIGRMELGQTFSSRNEINQALLHQLDDATATWGVKVTRVEVQNITPTKTVLDAMEQERAAQSRRKALETEAEGRKRADILEAEGKKQAAIAEAEAVVESIRKLSDALGGGYSAREILRYLVAQRYVDANYRLGESQNSKIVFMDPKALTEALGELIEPGFGDTNRSSQGGSGGTAGSGSER